MSRCLHKRSFLHFCNVSSLATTWECTGWASRLDPCRPERNIRCNSTTIFLRRIHHNSLHALTHEFRQVDKPLYPGTQWPCWDGFWSRVTLAFECYTVPVFSLVSILTERMACSGVWTDISNRQRGGRASESPKTRDILRVTEGRRYNFRETRS
jgi:hypothetical protein